MLTAALYFCHAGFSQCFTGKIPVSPVSCSQSGIPVFFRKGRRTCPGTPGKNRNDGQKERKIIEDSNLASFERESTILEGRATHLEA